MLDAKTVGKNIANLRKQKGWTQVELAEKLNVSDKTVSKWESGAGFPEISQFPELSRLFDTSVDNLLNGKMEIEAQISEIELCAKNDDINLFNKIKLENRIAEKDANGKLLIDYIRQYNSIQVFAEYVNGISETPKKEKNIEQENIKIENLNYKVADESSVMQSKNIQKNIDNEKFAVKESGSFSVAKNIWFTIFCGLALALYFVPLAEAIILRVTITFSYFDLIFMKITKTIYVIFSIMLLVLLLYTIVVQIIFLANPKLRFRGFAKVSKTLNVCFSSLMLIIGLIFTFQSISIFSIIYLIVLAGLLALAISCCVCFGDNVGNAEIKYVYSHKFNITMLIIKIIFLIIIGAMLLYVFLSNVAFDWINVTIVCLILISTILIDVILKTVTICTKKINQFGKILSAILLVINCLCFILSLIFLILVTKGYEQLLQFSIALCVLNFLLLIVDIITIAKQKRQR